MSFFLYIISLLRLVIKPQYLFGMDQIVFVTLNTNFPVSGLGMSVLVNFAFIDD